MLRNFQTHCYIDSNNSSNKCEDKNYVMVYDNKGTDVYKVNYYTSVSDAKLIPGSNNSSTNTGSTNNTFNNNTQPYAHINHNNNNNTYTYK